MKLNILEKYNPKIEIINGLKKVLCLIRKSYVLYTEEEKIRQAFLHFLISEVKVPIDRIVLEKKVKSNYDDLGRIDILVYDEYDEAFIIYECKKENEFLTDEIYLQGIKYFTAFNNVGYLGFVIGEELIFYGYRVINDEIERFELTNHPTYYNLHTGKDIEYYLEEETKYERLSFLEPIDESIINQFYDYGIFGKKTDRKLVPFMINFYNWMHDTEDKLVSNTIHDIGLKFTKFGNAVSTFSAMNFRSFVMDIHNDKQIFCLALSSMKSGEKVEFGTGLIIGIENSKTKHSSLQLRIENSVLYKNNSYEVWHNGTITIGKIGAAKKSDLVAFIKDKKPELVVEDQIYLGKFNSISPIKSNSQEMHQFLNNIFNYCILRDEFREIKKRLLLT